MAHIKSFYAEGERLKALGKEIKVDTHVSTGSLVILNGEAVVVSDDYMGVQFLPKDIKTEKEALAFINRNLFNITDKLIHRKGGEYIVLAVPTKNSRLEYCDEPYYEYISLRDNTKWIRRKSEMEDGRFSVVPD